MQVAKIHGQLTCDLSIPVCTTIFAASLLALCIARDESYVSVARSLDFCVPPKLIRGRIYSTRREKGKQDMPFIGSSVFNILFVSVATGLLYTTRRTPPFLAAQRIQVIALTAFLIYALGLWAWESEAVRRGWTESGEEAKEPWSWAAWCEAYSQSGMEAPLLDFNIINLAMMLVGKAWGLEPKGEDDDEQLVEEGRADEKAGLAADEKVGDVKEEEIGTGDEKRGFEGFPA